MQKLNKMDSVRRRFYCCGLKTLVYIMLHMNEYIKQIIKIRDHITLNSRAHSYKEMKRTHTFPFAQLA